MAGLSVEAADGPNPPGRCLGPARTRPRPLGAVPCSAMPCHAVLAAARPGLIQAQCHVTTLESWWRQKRGGTECVHGGHGSTHTRKKKTTTTTTTTTTADQHTYTHSPMGGGDKLLGHTREAIITKAWYAHHTHCTERREHT